jgi:hypothetical protein
MIQHLPAVLIIVGPACRLDLLRIVCRGRRCPGDQRCAGAAAPAACPDHRGRAMTSDMVVHKDERGIELRRYAFMGDDLDAEPVIPVSVLIKERLWVEVGRRQARASKIGCPPSLPSPPDPIKDNSMAQPINSVPKSNKNLVAAVIGWSIIALAVVGGTGFYFGLKYEQNQTAAKKAAVQDALKAAAPAPGVAAEASK